MSALARGDEQRILRFLAEADSFGGEHPFEGEFLTQLGKLVPAQWVGFGRGPDHDPAGPNYFGFDRPGDEHVFDHVDWSEVLPILNAELPVFGYLEHNFGAVKSSDFLNLREVRRSRPYNLALKPAGLEHVLALRLPTATEMFFIFDRVGRDFTERDRKVLLTLSPHLVRLHSASQTRRRLRAALALHESSQAAVVLLEADDRVAFASTAARELLDRYFGENGAGLPESVASWLRDRRRAATVESLRIDAVNRALVVELVDDALLLDEQRSISSLTEREREILDLLAEGRTNAEIAERLWISVGTVRKHLDNVYAKLGVHTRTAAAAFVHGRQRLSYDP